jgi:hypothetical protein
MKFKFLICFCFERGGRLRSKQRIVEAESLSAAIKQIRAEFKGVKIKVTSCEVKN